jgi:hypothetical protein
MAIYHIERQVIVSETFIEVWEVEANDEVTAVDIVDSVGTRLSTEGGGAEPAMECYITEIYKVAE